MINDIISNIEQVRYGSVMAEKMYIGSTVVWQAPSSRLPQGYMEVEYIASTSTGGQYIDINVQLYATLNTDYDIAIKFNCIGQGKSTGDTDHQAAIFNCQQTDKSPWPGTCIRKVGNVLQGRYIGGTAKDNTIGYFNVIHELPVQTPPDKNVTNLNNSGNTHSYSTTLFCAYKQTNVPYRFMEAKLYYFKLFVEGTLVRDMVPCKNSSDVVGLYDLVNDVFYTSPNGALFEAGPYVAS